MSSRHWPAWSRSRQARVLPAWVLGDVNLVTSLGLAGIPSVLVADAAEPAAHSRYVVRRVAKPDHWERPRDLVHRLLQEVQGAPDRPVLFYQTDGDLLLVSRYRQELATCFRFVVADAEVVETAVNKERFAEKVERCGLPVPRSRVVQAGEPLVGFSLRFPVICKPLLRRDLRAVGLGGAKAVAVHNRGELEQMLRQLAGDRVRLIAQELVPGPETCMESYHAYMDDGGAVVGEFTGAKIRTNPVAYGETTALRLTEAADVVELGREVVRQLGLTGVVKVDFKRDPAGSLVLLEVNPRFNLWHLAATTAGLNLPALVYADLLGLPRPAVTAARTGVTWCEPLEDRHAYSGRRWPTSAWLTSVLSADVRSIGNVRDPGPLLRGALIPAIQRRFARPRWP